MMGFRMAALKGARWVLWILLAWVFVRGLASFFVSTPKAPAEAAAPPPAVVQTADREAPAAFAALFAHEYLTWQAGKDSDRAARLQGLISQKLDAQAGWMPGQTASAQIVEATWPYQITDRGDSRWLVTVAARVTTTATETHTRTVYLAVPVWGAAGSYIVSDYPTIVRGPEPPAGQEPAPAGNVVNDADGQIRALLTGFFRAYAQGGAADVAYFLEPGMTLRGLEGAQVFKAMGEMAVRRTGGETWATAQVIMEDPVTGSSTKQRYTVQVVQRDGRWYIKQIVEKGA